MTTSVAPVAPLVSRPPVLLPDTWSPSLSPDGRRVAFVSDRDGAPRVWLQDLASETPVPLDTGPEPVLQVNWAPDGEWIACVVAPGGAPRHEVHLIRPDGSQPHQVAGFDGATAMLGGWIAGTSLLAVTEVDKCSRAMVVDPATGAHRVLVEGDLLLLLDVTRDGSTALLRRGPRDARWLEVLDVATGRCRRLPVGDGPGSTDRGWFSVDGRTAYARTDVDAELASLVAVDLTDATLTILARRHDAELEDVTFTEDRGTAALLWNRYGGTSELTLLELDTHTERPVTPAGEVFDGCAFSADGTVLSCAVQNPVRPRAVWVCDLSDGYGRLLFDAPTAGVAPQLCDVHTADGLTISGWLYRPDGDGPWPTVVSLHGGPESQERPGYHPLFQALVAQGLAVFAPNVRGSSGFGRSFLEADNLAGRYGAIADVAACVEYLIEVGVAWPGRIGCMGRSYGGYLTLAALVTFPELFAVGVSECGMSDFETFFARSEPWIAAAAVSKYGHPEHDRELLRDLSPLHRIDRLAAPLLLIHGANDTNVPVYESEQVVRALRERGAPHEYLLLPGEGHVFLTRDGHRAAIGATVAWLTRYLRAPDRSTWGHDGPR